MGASSSSPEPPNKTAAATNHQPPAASASGRGGVSSGLAVSRSSSPELLSPAAKSTEVSPPFLSDVAIGLERRRSRDSAPTGRSKAAATAYAARASTPALPAPRADALATPTDNPDRAARRWHFVALAYGSLREKAIEIVSPGDRKPGKLECYADHRVEELLIVDPQEKTSSWLGLEAGEYKHSKRSRLIDLGAAGLAERID